MPSGKVHLRKEEQVSHGSTMGPDQNGGVLEEGNLLPQVHALYMDHPHHTAMQQIRHEDSNNAK